jgi:hypothetical protein
MAKGKKSNIKHPYLSIEKLQNMPTGFEIFLLVTSGEGLYRLL